MVELAVKRGSPFRNRQTTTVSRSNGESFRSTSLVHFVTHPRAPVLNPVVSNWQAAFQCACIPRPRWRSCRVHHGFDFGNQPLQVFRRIHNGDDHGLILPDEAMAVDLGGLAVPFKAAKYRGARDP